jgi:O-acetyl-ADP-ribose deacetylase (regulator of RNase III)
MELYLKGSLDPFVPLLEVHKLMYFMQEAGEPLKLRFAEAPYGPYAENLRHVLNAMEGHFVSGYGVGGDQPDKTLELVPGAAADAQRVLAQRPETRRRFERVSRLVDGFESPYGMELLATVHWIVTRRRPGAPDEAVEHFYRWAPRKRTFSRDQILLALNALESRGWIRTLPGA